MTTETRNNALRTYRSLRSGMVVMIVMLAVALALELWKATCVQTSISAYYFTSAHSIFIAVLCALGALLIVYEGSNDTEDVLLNLAGVLAFVVATVPTSRPAKLCGISGLPADYDVRGLIPNNIWTVVITLGAAQLLYWIFATRNTSPRRTSLLGIAGLCVFWTVIVLCLLALIRSPERFYAHAHNVAAVILFLAIFLVVCITAFLVKHQEPAKSRHQRGYYRLYVLIAAAMFVTLIAAVALHLTHRGPANLILIAETFLIVEFAAYWALQTIELWKTSNRKEMLSEGDQQLLAAGRDSAPSEAPTPPGAVTTGPRARRLMRAL